MYLTDLRSLLEGHFHDIEFMAGTWALEELVPNSCNILATAPWHQHTRGTWTHRVHDWLSNMGWEPQQQQWHYKHPQCGHIHLDDVANHDQVQSIKHQLRETWRRKLFHAWNTGLEYQQWTVQSKQQFSTGNQLNSPFLWFASKDYQALVGKISHEDRTKAIPAKSQGHRGSKRHQEQAHSCGSKHTVQIQHASRTKTNNGPFDRSDILGKTVRTRDNTEKDDQTLQWICAKCQLIIETVH